MSQKVLTYASSLTDICTVNSSFDSGVLRIAYPGLNRNNSFISKESMVRNMKTIYNCPVVCHYDVYEDELGGHDIALATNKDGDRRIINITEPVGVIPESAKTWFANYEEDDGTVHEYLYAEVLLWKRQAAYKKLKDDGVTSHSMEIDVTSGKMVDGVYHIDDFQFTAFALIGVEPCFESSALQVFSQSEYKKQFEEMMLSIKESFTIKSASSEDDDKTNEEMEGGETLDKDNAQKEFAEEEEIVEGGAAPENNEGEEPGVDPVVEDATEEPETHEEENHDEAEEEAPAEDGADEADFALWSNVMEAIDDVLATETITDEYGEFNRYFMTDIDFEAHEFYCYDMEDGKLYGFTYEMDGDTVDVDFKCKRRKKYAIVDFVEGSADTEASIVKAYNKIRADFASATAKAADFETKFNEASASIESLNTEVEALRQFKSDTEAKMFNKQLAEVFSNFEDLVGVEAFEALRNDCKALTIEEIEEKCYAIRGRQAKPAAKFNYRGQDCPKLPVLNPKGEKEPYGGIVARYRGSK